MDGLIVLNFKTYDESTGDKAVALAKLCDMVAKETGAKIVAVPSFRALAANAPAD